ncbi:coiled-coil domain-containing protein 117 isoform X2 [Genypterus blacodes]|uniref:coiled-coil domain-containing protein 117 isoform X2 n=1 Tax=Genypterus blacodes TaxID=154954 RepID=UPI003F760ECB
MHIVFHECSRRVGKERSELSSWEKRCLRKHRRRVYDEGCSAKRRRMMVDAEVDVSESSVCPPPPVKDASPALPQPCPVPVPLPSPALPRPETDASCMEVEAAQRRLQEIEARITLEDDDEDEDLDVEPTQRRPVLVLSQSLKEGLQRGISDILPHTVAQSVSHSCMELVLWRPPDDTFARRLRDSIQMQRKQQTASRQPPTPCPSPAPRGPLSPTAPPTDTQSPLYSFPGAHSSGEEDMEM